jgi:hypothetical protein
VNWFKKFFNKDAEEYVDVLSVPVTTILRWYLYDTAISDEKELSDLIGLSPISDEGEAKELEDSENRLSELGFIFPYLDAMSDISANFITTIHAKEAAKIEGVDLQEADLEAMLSTYKLVAFSTLVGTLSIAVNLGLLRPGNVASEPDMEGFFDE